MLPPEWANLATGLLSTSSRPRPDQQPLSSPPRPPPRQRVSSRPDPGLSDLGRGHRRGRHGIAVSVPGLIACIVAATPHQVDGAPKTVRRTDAALSDAIIRLAAAQAELVEMARRLGA